jgi:hypothetical protein
MNYRIAKNQVVSELIDPANITSASLGFCFKSNCVAQPDTKVMLTDYSPKILYFFTYSRRAASASCHAS